MGLLLIVPWSSSLRSMPHLLTYKATSSCCLMCFSMSIRIWSLDVLNTWKKLGSTAYHVKSNYDAQYLIAEFLFHQRLCSNVTGWNSPGLEQCCPIFTQAYYLGMHPRNTMKVFSTAVCPSCLQTGYLDNSMHILSVWLIDSYLRRLHIQHVDVVGREVRTMKMRTWWLDVHFPPRS